MKELVAQRVPPGDRWTLLEDESDIVFGSLTDCLNQIYVVHQATQFFIDAKKGQIHDMIRYKIVVPYATKNSTLMYKYYTWSK